MDGAKTTYDEAEKEVRESESAVSALRAKQKDERKETERVNSLLSHFFVHDGIKFEAKDDLDQATDKLEITRDGKSTYNLSEDECS